MKVGVIGAGTMGAGICEVFAKAGWDVAMTASSAASAQKHKDKLAAGYAKKVAKGKMAQEKADAILAKIIPGAKEDVCGDCDLIVECSKEDMGMKKQVFTELMSIVGPDCWFATKHLLLCPSLRLQTLWIVPLSACISSTPLLS